MEGLEYCENQTKNLQRTLDISSDNSEPALELSDSNLKNKQENRKERKNPVAKPRKTKLSSSDESDKSSGLNESGSDEIKDGEYLDELKRANYELKKKLKVEEKKNEDLKERLLLSECDLETTKAELDLEKTRNREYDAGTISALVANVHDAQKVREVSMVTRLKQAVQERDEAILRAKAFNKYYKDKNQHKHLPKVEQNLHQIIDSIVECDSSLAAVKLADEFVDQISRMKDQEEDHVGGNLRKIIDERDAARKKCRELNCELDLMKKKPDVENLQEKISNLQMEVLSATEEKTEALNKLSSVSEDLQALRLHFSIQNSITDHIDKKRSEDRGDAGRLADALRVAHEHSKIKDANIRRLKTQNDSLNEKNARLDRLANTLRRKLAAAVEKYNNQLDVHHGYQ